jgi:hypothetical protein
VTPADMMSFTECGGFLGSHTRSNDFDVRTPSKVQADLLFHDEGAAVLQVRLLTTLSPSNNHKLFFRLLS